MAHAPDSSHWSRRSRLSVEELEPRNLPSSTALLPTAATPPADVQKLSTSALVMQFIVAVSSGGRTGVAQGVLPLLTASSPFAPSAAPANGLGALPAVRMMPAAGVVPGGFPTPLAKSVALSGGGTAATINTQPRDEFGEEDPLAPPQSVWLAPSPDRDSPAVESSAEAVA